MRSDGELGTANKGEEMFSKWFARADTALEHLEGWQYAKYKRQMKKAYEAGRKQGREETLLLAENAAILREKLGRFKGDS